MECDMLARVKLTYEDIQNPIRQAKFVQRSVCKNTKWFHLISRAEFGIDKIQTQNIFSIVIIFFKKIIIFILSFRILI